MYFIIVTASLDPASNQVNWRMVLRRRAAPSRFPVIWGVRAIDLTVFTTITTVAGNRPELKWQKKTKTKKKTVCYKFESITQEKKNGNKEGCEMPRALFFKDVLVFLLSVEWVWHKQTAASSLGHWKHFLLGEIEIMVRSCQCETHVFFNKGHI